MVQFQRAQGERTDCHANAAALARNDKAGSLCINLVRPYKKPERDEYQTAMNYYVYILTNDTNVALYIGVTNHLLRRVWEHRNAVDPESYTAKYGIHKLVYYEQTGDVRAAIAREKQLKSWNRARKNKLVESMNPTWKDLSETME